LILSLGHAAHHFALGANRLGCRELAARIVFLRRLNLKLTGSDARLEAGPHLGIGGFAHPAPESIAEESAFVGHGLALEATLAGEGDGLGCLRVPNF
jgi:hypothetical protein